jgi:bifunctional UDP-N-acetylglucosamine pyrophosphorylase/glucosamine-1-phosphate N-acetyltransferase
MSAPVAVILAAGEGKRMKSNLAKVLHEVCDRPMVSYVIQAVHQAGCERVILIVGHQRERVGRALRGEGVEFVVQREQLGTAHALMQARQVLADHRGDLLVLAGDTPMLTGETVSHLLDQHRSTRAAATVLTAVVEDPTGYGRILRTAENLLDAIVEDGDATPEQRIIAEINTGAYCFQAPLIFDILDQIDGNNRQGEFYLTDVIALLRLRGLSVAAVVAEDPTEAMGVNSVDQLCEAERLMAQRRQRKRRGPAVQKTQAGGVKTEKKG